MDMVRAKDTDRIAFLVKHIKREKTTTTHIKINAVLPMGNVNGK